jgi:uncharacterized protein YndB with AHSA1/START domain
MENEPIVIERTFNASAENVWHALTDPDAMKQWYFDIPEFKPEVGNEFRFIAGKDENSQYAHICVVTEVIPGRKLTYSWRYGSHKGISYVTFELFSQGPQTRLKFTHTGVETFPADIPDFARGNFVEGWTAALNALEVFVESRLA